MNEHSGCGSKRRCDSCNRSDSPLRLLSISPSTQVFFRWASTASSNTKMERGGLRSVSRGNTPRTHSPPRAPCQRHHPGPPRVPPGHTKSCRQMASDISPQCAPPLDPLRAQARICLLSPDQLVTCSLHKVNSVRAGAPRSPPRSSNWNGPNQTTVHVSQSIRLLYSTRTLHTHRVRASSVRL
jgi:hypothetical protein